LSERIIVIKNGVINKSDRDVIDIYCEKEESVDKNKRG